MICFLPQEQFYNNMVQFFSLTAVLNFILIIAAGADIALYVVGLIPLLICILIILICFISEFGIIILSYELYYKSLSMCDSIFLTAN